MTLAAAEAPLLRLGVRGPAGVVDVAAGAGTTPGELLGDDLRAQLEVDPDVELVLVRRAGDRLQADQPPSAPVLSLGSAVTAEPVAVLDLTDEELAVLATTEGAVVFPHLSELPEEAQRVAKNTAYRSLIAHGLLEAPSPSQVQQAEREALGTADGQVAYPVRMAEELARMLTLRAQATMVVCCARTTALGQEYRYAHVVAGVVLLETVTSTGLHRMSLLAEQDLLAHVRTWVLHPEATPGSGEDVIQLVGAGEDPTPPDELLDRLGAALLRADLVVRTADDEGGADLLGVFSGPAGTWSCRTAAGAAGPVVIRPSSPEGVLTELQAALEAVAA